MEFLGDTTRSGTAYAWENVTFGKHAQLRTLLSRGGGPSAGRQNNSEFE